MAGCSFSVVCFPYKYFTPRTELDSVLQFDQISTPSSTFSLSSHKPSCSEDYPCLNRSSLPRNSVGTDSSRGSRASRWVIVGPAHLFSKKGWSPLLLNTSLVKASRQRPRIIFLEAFSFLRFTPLHLLPEDKERGVQTARGRDNQSPGGLFKVSRKDAASNLSPLPGNII